MSEARAELRERLVAAQRAMEAAEALFRNACTGDYSLATTVGPGIEAARHGIEQALRARLDDRSTEG
jgi:hypothetical protein